MSDYVVNMRVSAHEYRHCAQCALPDCDDEHPQCPLPCVNGTKREEARPKRAGQGTAVPVEVNGTVFASVRQACLYHGASVGWVYARAKRLEMSPEAVLGAVYGNLPKEDWKCTK